MAIMVPTRHLLYFLIIAYEAYILMANLLISYYAYRASRILSSRNMLLLSVGIMLFGIYMLTNSLINISVLAYLYYEPARRLIYVPPSVYPWLIMDGLMELASLILISLALSLPAEAYMLIAGLLIMHANPIFVIHSLSVLSIIFLSYICILLWLRFSQGNSLVMLTALAFTLLLFNIPVEVLVFIVTNSLFLELVEERLVYSVASTILLVNVIRVVHYGKAQE